MRRSKRFLSVLLALVLCLSMLPVNALALELPALDVLEDVIAVVEEEEAVEDAIEAVGMLKDNLNVDDDSCVAVETAQTLESYNGYVRTESEFQDALLNNTVIYLKKDIELTGNYTIPSGKSVIIEDGFELRISMGATLINEGCIQIGMATYKSDTEIVYNTGYLIVEGALVNDAQISIIKNATVTIEDNAVFSNDGDITIGKSFGYINENGIFEWESEAATLVVEGTINNDGVMQIGDEGILELNGEVNGDGVVLVWVNEENDLNMCETLKELFDCHIYVGEDFELTKDFVLEEGYLYIGNEATLTVNPGVRFTVEETGRVFVGSFDYGPIGEDNENDVWGKLYIQGDLLNNGMLVVHERGELIIEGTYSGNGYVSYADGSEDDESEIKLAEVTTADELREAVNSGYTSIWIVENIAINEDLHLTEEMGVKIKNNATLTVPKGVKLTNDGYMLIGDSKGTFDDNDELILEYEKGVLNIEGEFVNNGSIDVLEWGQLRISGEVSGSGLAWIIVDDPLDFEMYKTMPTEFECRLWVENDMSLVDDLFVDSNDVITIENEAVLMVPVGTVLGNNGMIDIGISYSYEVDGVTYWDHIGGTLCVQGALENYGEVNVAKQGKLIVSGSTTGEGVINSDIDEENESKAGDLDGDGMIETEDLVHLMKCVVNDESDYSEKAGDVNEDGKVDILDVIRLIRILAA